MGIVIFAWRITGNYAYSPYNIFFSVLRVFEIFRFLPNSIHTIFSPSAHRETKTTGVIKTTFQPSLQDPTFSGQGHKNPWSFFILQDYILKIQFFLLSFTFRVSNRKLPNTRGIRLIFLTFQNMIQFLKGTVIDIILDVS